MVGLVRTEAFWSPPSAAAAPPAVLGTPSVQHKASADPQSFDYTLESGADGLVVVLGLDEGDTFTSATWTATGAAGQGMTALTAQAETPTTCQIFYLAAPNVGSAAGVGVLAVDLSGTAVISAVIYSISGWSGVAPVEAGQHGANITDPDPLAIDPDPNSLIIHGVCLAAAGPTMTFGTAADETEDGDAAGTGLRIGAAHKQVVSGDATTVNVVFSSGPTRYAEVAAAFPA